MKPGPDVSGMPYNFDKLPLWLFPSLWDETKQVRLRGLWFMLLYALSLEVFLGMFAFFGAIIFSRPISSMLWFTLIFSILGGSIIGLFNWLDFTRRRQKLLAEKSSFTSQNTPE